MKRAIFLLFIIFILLTWVSRPVYGKVPRRESDALRTFFNAAGGKDWSKRDNWKSAPGTENTWYGVTCDAGDTTVLELELRDNNLSGELPAELGDLKNLKSLVLSSNRLTGIHQDLGKLTNLTTLDISGNRLSGPIPSCIRGLKNLKTLNLSHNYFSGGLPVWIGELENLETLNLDGNRLSGPIPGALANLSRLTVLRLGHNRLTGQIPAALGNLTRLADNRCNFKWNGLYTTKPSLNEFLKKKQSGKDWESTQTVAPGEIKAVSSAKTSITLTWKPIDYTEDSGGYHVLYSTTPGGAYRSAGSTEDKTVTELEVKDLEESTNYYFVVRTWTAPHGSNRSRVESVGSEEVPAATRGTTLAGYVKTAEGQGVPGVEIMASNQGGKAYTDSRGNYNLSVTPGWSGTVTPVKKGFDFSPSSLEYSSVDTDREGQDYGAEANTKISGQIADSTGEGAAEVTVTFTDDSGRLTGTTATDAAGNYIYTVAYNWAGLAVPSKTGYKFEPAETAFPGVVAAEPGKGYKAFMLPAIGGRVKTRGGRGMTDVTVTFTDREKTPGGSFTLPTGENGEYAKIFMNDWSGRVKPVKPGYRFYPKKRKYKHMTIDTVKRRQDYRAELDLKFFISVTGSQMIPSEEGFEDIYGKGLFTPEINIGYKILGDVYLWGGYGFASKTGTVPIFEGEATWKQSFVSFGLGYNGNLSALLGYKFDLGVILVNYSEEAFEESASEKTFGMRVDVGSIFKFTDRLFTEISLGYLFADDTVNTEAGDIKLKLGGLRAGIGLGLRF
jgi:hypothetical protein